MTDELRPCVLKFARAMEERMHLNDLRGKQGWDRLHAETCLKRAFAELAEMKLAGCTAERIALEVADVANYLNFYVHALERDEKAALEKRVKTVEQQTRKMR